MAGPHQAPDTPDFDLKISVYNCCYNIINYPINETTLVSYKHSLHFVCHVYNKLLQLYPFLALPAPAARALS